MDILEIEKRKKETEHNRDYSEKRKEDRLAKSYFEQFKKLVVRFMEFDENRGNLYLLFLIELLNILLLFIYWYIGYYDSTDIVGITMLRIAFIVPIIGYILSLVKNRMHNKSLTSVYRSQRPEDESIIAWVIVVLFVIWIILLTVNLLNLVEMYVENFWGILIILIIISISAYLYQIVKILREKDRNLNKILCLFGWHHRKEITDIDAGYWHCPDCGSNNFTEEDVPGY